MDLTCPKCHAPMRTYERNGVHVDQCTDCRGIFLDRGELERLSEAESRWHSGDPAPAAAQGQPHAPHAAPQHRSPQQHQPQGQLQGQPQAQPSLGGMVGEVLQQVRAQQSGGHGPQRYQQPYKPRKKQSFLGELFG